MRGILSILFFCSFSIANVSQVGAQDLRVCNEMLIPSTAKFESSITRFVSLINALKEAKSESNETGISVGYAGFQVGFNDANTLSSFVQNDSHDTLSESQSVSVVTSQLPVELAKNYVDCIRATKQDVTMVTSQGADNQHAFQIHVTWTPTYDVPVVSGTTARPVQLLLTPSGGVAAVSVDGAVSPAMISPTKTVSYSVTRASLDEPLYITAVIDGRSSDILSFPSRAKKDISLSSVTQGSPLIRRSGHYGPDAASFRFCRTEPGEHSIYLPSSVKAEVTGAAYEWQPRSKI